MNTLQGFFQTLPHTSVFVFQIEFVKGLFLHQRPEKKQQMVCRALWGQSTGGGPTGKSTGSSVYLGFENLLLQLKINHLLLIIAQFTSYIACYGCFLPLSLCVCVCVRICVCVCVFVCFFWVKKIAIKKKISNYKLSFENSI